MLTGTEIRARLPEEPTDERERILLELFEDGNVLEVEWVPVPLEHGAHKGVAWMMADALRVGTADDHFRVSVRAPTLQKIADAMGALGSPAVLPTTKLWDAAWLSASASRLEPCLQPPDDRMATTTAMVSQDRCIRERLRAEGLRVNGGKAWVLTNHLLARPGRVANYGFFSDEAPHRTASGLRAWQPLGLAHGYGHVDYSQLAHGLVQRRMLADGAWRDFGDVATDPELAGLVSSEGTLGTLRLPGVGRDIGVGTPSDADELATIRRTLYLRRPYMVGDDVRVWQRFLGVVADGAFGPVTAAETADWQSSHMGAAAADGIVGPRTLAAARAWLAKPPEGGLDDFIQARNFTRASRAPGDVYWLVVHTMEAPEKPTTARAVARWFAGESAPRASAHWCFDSVHAIGCVRPEDVAWGAPGANRYGLHAEHAGYARQTGSEWADDFSRDMLALSARVCGEAMRRYQIPVRFVDAGQLRRARGHYARGEPVPPELWGVTTHAETTRAWGLSTHTDPGAHFPMAEYSAMLARAN